MVAEDRNMEVEVLRRHKGTTIPFAALCCSIARIKLRKEYANDKPTLSSFYVPRDKLEDGTTQSSQVSAVRERETVVIYDISRVS